MPWSQQLPCIREPSLLLIFCSRTHRTGAGLYSCPDE